MFADKQNDDGSYQKESKGIDSRVSHKVSKQGFFNPNVAQRVIFFDDFLGDALDARWSGGAGVDGTAPAITAGAGGTVVLTAGAGATSIAANSSVLTHELNYLPSDGNLFMEARVKMSALTGGNIFIGFHDTKGTTTAEMPFTMSGTTLTDVATDAVGFFYDDAATSTNIGVAATKNNTEQSADLGSTYPASNLTDGYAIYRVEIDSSGHAKLFINGTFVYGFANAVTTSVKLTPCVTVSSASGAAARTATVDFVHAGHDRV